MNETHKLIVVGDIHLQNKEPKKSNAIDTLNWIFDNKELNNKNNSLLLLGDMCEVNSPFELYGIFVDLFTNKSSFAKVWIVQGNHDCINMSSVLSLFAPLKNVEVIQDWRIIDFYNCKILALPFYSHEGVANKQPMTEVYSNLYKNEELMNLEIDYCCGHLESDRCHFSKKYCDLSKLTNVKHFLHGHIHNCDIDKGYLGSACANSVAERNIDKKIAIIDGETKECEFVTLPKFMEYYTVEYPNKLEKPKTRYAIFTVKNALDKNVASEEYSKQAKEMGFEFYTNKVLKQRVTEVEIDDAEICSKKPNFETFAKSVGLSNEVFDICNEVIRLKSEE